MKCNKLAILIVSALIVCLLITGCGSSKDEQSAAEVKKIPVSAIMIEKGNLDKSIKLGGLLQPQDEVYLASKNPANKITSVPVKIGDRVSQGSPLVIFDSRDIDLQLEQAQLNFDRNQKLYDLGAVSQSQLEQLENALENLKIAKETTVLTSPISGVVASVTAVEGQLAGASPLVSVVNTDRLKLTVQVGEKHISKLKVGEEIEVNIPSLENKAFQAVITATAPHIDARSKAYPVILEIENREDEIKGGMYGEVGLIVDHREDVLVVPQFAIVEYNSKKVVFIVENDIAVRKEVVIGLAVENKAEVLEGLQEGDILVVEGQYGIKDGSPVQAVIRGEQK